MPDLVEAMSALGTPMDQCLPVRYQACLTVAQLIKTHRELILPHGEVVIRNVVHVMEGPLQYMWFM